MTIETRSDDFFEIGDSKDALAIDTETTGLKWPIDSVFGFSVAIADRTAYWDIRKTPKAIDWLNDQLETHRGKVVCHNASFDYKMLSTSDCLLPLDRLDDTVIRACQINEHLRQYDLDTLGLIYLDERKETHIYRELADLFGGLATKNVQMKNLYRAPVELVAKYARQDARLALNLYHWQEQEIERQGIQQICEFERRTMPRLIEAEVAGIRVDLDAAQEAIVVVEKELKTAEKTLKKLCGKAINVNSPAQIRTTFDPKWTKGKDGVPGFWSVGDIRIGTTDTGSPSFSADYLRELAKHDPRAQQIIDVRQLIRTSKTFLRTHVCESSVKGRVYPSVNQCKGVDGGTGTGRLSYSNPPLQQIPNRNKVVASQVKRTFLPDEGFVWLDCDMSSFEVRVAVHYFNMKYLIEQFLKNPRTDFHASVAELMQVPRNPQPDGGANAKTLNLALIFNSGEGAIAASLGLPYTWETFTTKEGEIVTYRKPGKETQALLTKYHRMLPGVKKLIKAAKTTAEQRGYIFTHHGRRLRFPRGFRSYSAAALLIQSTAADINKENWTKIHDALDGEGRLMLNTHDSYSLSIPEERIKPIWERARNEIEKGYPWFRLPLCIDLSGVGVNWWNAISKEK